MAINELFKLQVSIANNGRPIKVKNPRKWLFPHSAERTYERQLMNLNSEFNNVVKDIVYPELDSLIAASQSLRPDDKKLTIDISWIETVKQLKAATDLTLSRIANSKRIEQLTTEQAERISSYNKEQFVKVIHSAVKVNPIISEPYLETQLKAFQTQNTALITKLSKDVSNRMEETLMRNLSAGNGNKVIKQELEKGFGIDSRRARLIARDQTNKFNGQLAQLRQEELGIEEYQWRGVLDERERETHRANEGKIFSWKDPSPITGHPGSQVQCRCTAKPIITDEMFD